MAKDVFAIITIVLKMLAFILLNVARASFKSMPRTTPFLTVKYKAILEKTRGLLSIDRSYREIL